MSQLVGARQGLGHGHCKLHVEAIGELEVQLWEVLRRRVLGKFERIGGRVV